MKETLEIMKAQVEECKIERLAGGFALEVADLRVTDQPSLSRANEIILRGKDIRRVIRASKGQIEIPGVKNIKKTIISQRSA